MPVGPSGGSYDPVPAKFVVPSYSVTSGEPSLTYDVNAPFCTRSIRFRPRDSRELQKQNQTLSQTVVYINCRRDAVSETVTPNTRIYHRSAIYEIVGINPIDYQYDEMEFLCQAVIK